jgi:hypothetical protein
MDVALSRLSSGYRQVPVPMMVRDLVVVLALGLVCWVLIGALVLALVLVVWP